MSQINVRNISNENNDGGPDIVGVSTFSATSYMVPPSGTTAQRPQNPQSGDLRFNTDIGSLEYFRGDTLGWEQIEMTSPDLDGGARGMFAGGQNAPSGTKYSEIDYVTIPTLGNAIDFGDLSDDVHTPSVTASRTRGIGAGGYPTRGDIDYWTIASTGSAVDSGGDLTVARRSLGGSSNSTRGILFGGQYTNPNSDNSLTSQNDSNNSNSDIAPFRGAADSGSLKDWILPPLFVCLFAT